MFCNYYYSFFLRKKNMQTDYNAKYWKSRSVRRNAENKELKKRIKELKVSRDKWKQKYMNKKAQLEETEKEVRAIKEKIEKIVNL